MLTIRAAQLKVFAEVMQERFISRLLTYCRERMADQFTPMDDEALRAWLRRAVARAGSYGIEIEWDVCRFVQHTVHWGLDFEIGPGMGWVSEILQDPGLDGTTKMDCLDNHCSRLQRG